MRLSSALRISDGAEAFGIGVEYPFPINVRGRLEKAVRRLSLSLRDTQKKVQGNRLKALSHFSNPIVGDFATTTIEAAVPGVQSGTRLPTPTPCRTTAQP